MTTTKANSNSAYKRRVLATVLALAATQGKGDGVRTAVCVACGVTAVRGLGAGDDMRLELGHDTSEANGGEYRLGNLFPLCGSCNDDMGTDNMSDILIPIYNLYAGWNGQMASDPGSQNRKSISRRAQWNSK